ncbi:MAG TPA: type II secretion system F family protein [Verrucomicrobiota bacterium]|nr:pilus assembly protein PilC [Verrucomicrobiales bacterium]HRI13774.1 type II secretion system F family protein [Verrucomicrobiota bacterium]
MPKFQYVAMDSRGKEQKGVLEVASQADAINRLKEMGYFPTKVMEAEKPKAAKKDGKKAAPSGGGGGGKKKGGLGNISIKIPGIGGGVKTKVLTTFTRQLATLVDAGLPLLRGLRVLQKQERNPTLRNTVDDLSVSIEGGSTFSEALAQHPKIFNRLFVNMVKAGELGGVLEVVLNRLAEFMEKAEKIKGKVVAAMFYPTAVMTVAIGILALLMVVVVPKFKAIFADLLGDAGMPAFTEFVLAISDAIKSKTIVLTEGPPYVYPGPVIWGIVAVFVLFKLAIRMKKGRWLWDKAKLHFPVIGSVIHKVAIARFCRTLGTLVSSGVPILQALNIVRDTAGNVVVASAVQQIHESVKEGETITAPLEKSGVFPPMVISMVDVGEQTGALPEMLLKIADTYDDEVDNAVAAMTSLLEPIMIVFLAVIVGSIVIALFLPLITLIDKLGSDSGDGGGD